MSAESAVGTLRGTRNAWGWSPAAQRSTRSIRSSPGRARIGVKRMRYSTTLLPWHTWPPRVIRRVPICGPTYATDVAEGAEVEQRPANNYVGGSPGSSSRTPSSGDTYPGGGGGSGVTGGNTVPSGWRLLVALGTGSGCSSFMSRLRQCVRLLGPRRSIQVGPPSDRTWEAAARGTMPRREGGRAGRSLTPARPVHPSVRILRAPRRGGRRRSRWRCRRSSLASSRFPERCPRGVSMAHPQALRLAAGALHRSSTGRASAPPYPRRFFSGGLMTRAVLAAAALPSTTMWQDVSATRVM